MYAYIYIYIYILLHLFVHPDCSPGISGVYSSSEPSVASR